MHDTVFKPQYRHANFLFSAMSRQAVGPPSLLFKGHFPQGRIPFFPGESGWDIELYLCSPIMLSWHA